MKKGFSLAELLISLAIISIIGAILLPGLVNSTPNKKKPLFKSAYKLTETIVSELINDNSLYSTGDFQNTAANYFCDNVTSKVNLLGTANCSTNLKPDTHPDTPNFTTSNGMRWWGFYNTFATGYANIWVDVNGGDSEGIGKDILRIVLAKNGKMTVQDTPEIDYLKD